MRILILSLFCLFFYSASAQVSPQNNKSSASNSDPFLNFTGISYSADDLSYLAEKLFQLDSIGASKIIIGGYLHLDSTDLSRALSLGENGPNFINISYEIKSSDPFISVNTECSKVGNSAAENISLSRAVRHSIIAYFNSEGKSVERIPDAIAYGIGIYIGYLVGSFEDVPLSYDDDQPSSAKESDGVLKSNLDYNVRNPELNPFVEVHQDQAFMSVSGVPIIIPGGSFVRFFQVGHKYQFCLHFFSLHSEGNQNLYLPLQFASNQPYPGYFSGYGYLPFPRRNEVQKPHIKYSYKDFVETPEIEDRPPYHLNRRIDVAYGVVYPCGAESYSAKYYVTTLPTVIDKVDFSDPLIVPQHPLSSIYLPKQYFSSNTKTDQLSFAGGLPTLSGWDPSLSQAVTADQNLDFSSRYACFVDSIVGISSVNYMLERNISYVAKLVDGSLVSIYLDAVGNKYCAYDIDPNDNRVDYLRYHPSAGWISVVIDSENPSEAVFQINLAIGKVTIQGTKR